MASPSSVENVNLLFLRHAQPIRDYIACAALGDQVLADDVFQETFLVVSRRAEDYDPERDFTAWVRGIARNLVLSELRKRQRAFVLSDEVQDLLAAEVPVVDAWENQSHAIRDCLAELAPKASELATLRFVEDLTPTVIAERVQWTVNAVNVALSRIRRRLRDCCQRRLEARP